MAETQPPSSGRRICQHGKIVGGLLHGWRYAFLCFGFKGDQLYVDVRAAQPGWPFPTEVRLKCDGKDFRQLRAVPGERAQRLDAEKLISEAAC